MFILFGYANNISSFPDIKIYGIYDHFNSCKERINSLCNNSVNSSQFNTNVIYSNKYTFWYKEIENLGDLEISVSNR